MKLSRGKIVNQENSGTVRVGVGFGVGEVEIEIEPSAMFIVCVLLQSPNCPKKSQSSISK